MNAYRTPEGFMDGFPEPSAPAPIPGPAAQHHPDAPHAIVIGSGFGGVAAAVRLGA